MTPRAFLNDVVRPNVADFHARYSDMRLAFNAVMAVDALAAHIFFWMRTNAPSEVADLKDDSGYRAKLAAQNYEFRLLRDIAKAQKHVELLLGKPIIARADQVSGRAIGYGEGDYGLGQHSGPPQVVVDKDDGPWVYLENVVDDALGILDVEMARLGL